MYLAHHDAAVASGARIVHACGFDSIPHDLGAWFTVQQLGSSDPITLRGVVRAGAQASGGTFHSAMGAMSRAKQMREAMVARRKKEGRAGGPQVARRSRASRTATATLGSGCCRCRPSTRSWWPGRARPWSPTARTSATATSPASRRCATPSARCRRGLRPARRRADPAGAQLPQEAGSSRATGPSEARREKSWFTVDFVGESGGQDGAHPGLRRRPRLHRDREDARRVGAVPGPRRQPADRRPGDHGDRDGARTCCRACRRPGSGSRRSPDPDALPAQAKSVSPMQPLLRRTPGRHGEQARAGVLEVLHQPVLRRRAGSASGCTACPGRARRR